MSASDALSAVKALYDVANKVKDNKDELLRVSQRIEHILVTIEESKSRDVIRPDDYNDVLTAIADLITRTQRVAQRLLKRNLGDRTWNTSEISSELKRLNDDVQNYLSVHTIRALDIIHTSTVEQHTVLVNTMEEMMVKVAELDLYLRPRPGDGWAPSVQSQAKANFERSINQAKENSATQLITLPFTSTPQRSLVPQATQSENGQLYDDTLKRSGKIPAKVTGLLSTRGDTAFQRSIIPRLAQPANEKLDDVNFETLRRFGRVTLKVTGLMSTKKPLTRRKILRDFLNAQDKSLNAEDLRLKVEECRHELMQAFEDAATTAQEKISKPTDHEFQLKADASRHEIMLAINDAATLGFLPPDKLYEEQKLSICVTDGDSVYDASVPGGLKVNKSEPLLWWWNKYTTFHGLAPATTPGHTIARLEHEYRTGRVTGVDVAGVLFLFHRTLRAPDTRINKLPKSLGTFPLVPVNRFFRGVPPALRDRGGFLMPIFRREAVYIQFAKSGLISGQAVKISVGGVNALSGIYTNSVEPPKFGAEQDYIVVGQQPWLDGIVSGPRVIRQFVATDLGSNYTVEEQVTGKAEIGGFQFDIFPRRPSVDGQFFHVGEKLNSIYSPSELELAKGDQLILERPLESATINWPQNEWTLADYKHRVSPSATIKAYYIPRDDISMSTMGVENWSTDRQVLGIAAGGQIMQKIYRDKDSPRVYDEEHGHRFYVHIVTPELWETITGVLPPITPITRDMCIQNGVNWYKIFDDYVDSITTISEALTNVLSVTQLDKKKLALSAENQADNLIDPEAHPTCSRHPGEASSCVFRPCNHLACVNCVGLATLGRFKCPKCQVVVKKCVGIQTPLSDVFQNKGGSTDEEDGEWVVKENEKLAATAASSDTVVIIHRPEDRPSPLYSSGEGEDHTLWTVEG